MGVAGSGNASMAAVATPTEVARIQPAPGGVVGVAHPVIVRFAEPITDRVAAEQTIKITSSKTPTGRFNWLNDNVVQWIPDEFWPAHHLITVRAGHASTEFETGAAVVGVVDIDGQSPLPDACRLIHRP